MPDAARAFWILAPGLAEIREVTVAPAGPGDVTVHTMFSGISRGTESLVFEGRVPPSEWERMRAPFQEGTFPGPLKYGYSSVGRIECGPPELRGQIVFALYPHQTRYTVPASAVHAVPANVPPARAVLAANMETAVNGLWDARPQAGDRILVVGAGTVGSLVAWLARQTPASQVELVDINPDRARIAAALGVRFARPADAMRDADVVVHASGSPAGLQTALDAAGFEATIVELSWFGDRTVPLHLGGAFHARRLTIRSSQVGSVAGAQRARWDTRRRIRLALELLADPALDALITGESDFGTLPAVMAGIAQDARGTLCHRIRY